MALPLNEMEARISAELSAIQVTLLAIIETYPDKKALLGVFDSITANVQINNAVSGLASTPPMLREALERLRSQIDSPGYGNTRPTEGK
jgi:hypothetical protein